MVDYCCKNFTEALKATSNEGIFWSMYPMLHTGFSIGARNVFHELPIYYCPFCGKKIKENEDDKKIKSIRKV